MRREYRETRARRRRRARERGRPGEAQVSDRSWSPWPALVAALALAACGVGRRRCDSGDSGDSGGSGTIAFLLPETQTARYESQDKPLFEAKVEELCPDCEIFYQNADQDPAKQQQQVEAAVTEGVDVLVLDPVDSTAAAGW